MVEPLQQGPCLTMRAGVVGGRSLARDERQNHGLPLRVSGTQPGGVVAQCRHPASVGPDLRPPDTGPLYPLDIPKLTVGVENLEQAGPPCPLLLLHCRAGAQHLLGVGQ